jgi:hypothetical protein
MSTRCLSNLPATIAASLVALCTSCEERPR